ncbi:related to acetylxylan esterase [Fusarium fujikuroi]|nr:Uncharacterized protein Y057_643 [Fusarium fujikuroi]SCN71737.1 related to acetylxylan esterase [Fusarium fujikuroi]SCN88346.1 related to acetylxylan esterase [Fusarium fujikuroi]SCO42252.1 related to acetylxylan esterase [Fusarium fujikuroi]VTT59324.1 unnamed protein product [Fusarium fujikuroi]
MHSAIWNTLTFLAVLMATSISPAVALPNIRVLPLGDSITKGTGSTGLVGYRLLLRQKILKQGVKVNMVGTLKNGNMVDGHHEGHSGKMLADINGYWQKPIQARPNVVLIHAGTNNMDQGKDLDIAASILADIVDGIFKVAPDVTICLAPVIWANDKKMQANTDKFNPQVRSLISARQKKGKHILEVPIDIKKEDLGDSKHPNDDGYEKMANAWLKAILEADKKGWLKMPIKMSPEDAPGTGLGA